MIAPCRCRWLAYLLGVVSIVVTGCRDTEPTPSHYRDLGEGDRVLLPGGSPWHAIPYKQGDTAEWVPFREPSAEALAEAGEGDEAGAEAGEATGLEAEIRELIDEYHEVVADRDVEEMLEYHVEEQQETLGAMFGDAVRLLDTMDALQEALAGKLPDDVERINAAFDTLKKGARAQRLVVESLSVESDVLVSGEPPEGAREPACRFKLIDDEWYIEIVDLPDYGQVKPQVDMLQAMFDGVMQGVEGGQVPAETLLQQLEAQVSAMGLTPPEPADEGVPDDASGEGGVTQEDG
jgi:hypothetical protein